MQARLLFVALVLVLFTIEVTAVERHLNSAVRRRRRTVSTATADVFIGYMDEEQYYTAFQVLTNKAKYSGVIVLERSNKNKQGGGAVPSTPLDDAGTAKKAASLLFQRPVCDDAVYPSATGGVWAFVPTKSRDGFTYPKAAAKICGGDDAPNAETSTFLTSLTAKLAAQSTAANTDLDKVWITSDLYPGIAKSKNILPLSFFVYAFGNIGTTNNLAIILRTPEMGLNPSAVAPSVEVELAALKAAGVNNINFWAIGAGGAANAADCAGCINFIQASWYGGVRVADKKIQTKIAYDVVGGADVDIKPTIAPASALKFTDVQTAFESMKSAAPDTATAAKDSFVRTYPKARIGTTYTYFGGWDSKQTSTTLGGHSANMEDYHVIHIINDVKADTTKYPTLGHEGIWRVDADPYQIETSDIDAVNAWMVSSAAFPTKTDLAAVLKWGVAGLKLSDITSNDHVMCWSLVKNLAARNAAVLKKFIVVPETTQCVLNPFYVELALDFWETSGKPEFQNLMATKKAKFAAGVAAIYANVPPTGDLSSSFTDVVDGLCEALWKDYDDRKKLQDDRAGLTTDRTADPAYKFWVDAAAVTSAGAIRAAGNNCPLWTRDNWGIYAAKTMKKKTDGTAQVPLAVHNWEFNGEGVDRIFYKASNLPGILNLNAKLFSGANKNPQDFTDQTKLPCTCT